MIYLVIIIMILHLTHNVSWFPLPSTTNVYTRITTGMNTNSWTTISMDTTTLFYRWWWQVFRDSVSNIFISTYSNLKLNQEQQTKDIILRRYISIIRVLQWFFNIGGRFNNAFYHWWFFCCIFSVTTITAKCTFGNLYQYTVINT